MSINDKIIRECITTYCTLLLILVAQYSKEDLAATLHFTMCTNLVNNVLDSLIMLKTKHVFIAGSFVNHPLTQKIVFEEFEYRKRELAGYLPGFVSGL